MSIDYKKLQSEIANDPKVKGYSGMDDDAIAESISAVNIPVQRDSIPGDELFGATDETEYLALVAAKRSEWLSLCSINSIQKAAVSIVKSVFAANSTTWGNIIKTKNISRLQEISAGNETLSGQMIANARDGSW